MRPVSIALAGVLTGSVLAGGLSAQPVLNRVEQIVRDQIGAARGAVAPPAGEPGYLGLIADDSQEEGRGVRVLDIAPGGPAAQAGLKQGDLITAIGTRKIANMDDMARALEGRLAAARLTVTVTRDGTERRQEITLGQRPAGRPTGRATESLPEPGPLPGAAPPSGPRLGVRSVPVSEEIRQQNKLPDTKGAVVTAVAAGSPAERAGVPLRAVIVAADNRPIESPDDLAAAVRAANRGQIELTYIAAGEAVQKTVELASATASPTPAPGPPAPPAAAPPGGPLLQSPADARIAALEARIRELEARLEKLEASPAPDAK
jgi:S1-C subfamily serine protease